MRAIKEARKFIKANPADPSAVTLSRLVLALESEADFPIADIYLLDYSNFKIALQILQEWRLDRHYAGKSKLLDTSRQATGNGSTAASTESDTNNTAAADAQPAEAAAEKKPAKAKAPAKRKSADK